ncbi:MAG: EpsG family protein [Oligoflexus sp.]
MVYFLIKLIQAINALAIILKPSRNLLICSFIFQLFLWITLLLSRDIFASNDSINYFNMFRRSNDFSYAMSVYHKDYFYSLLNFLVAVTLGDFESLVSILAISSCFMIAWSCVKSDLNLSNIFLMFFMYTMISSTSLLFTNVLRQGLAQALFLLSIIYLLKNRYSIFLCFAVLASLSHKSTFVIYAVIGIFYFLPKLSRNSLYALAGLAFCFVALGIDQFFFIDLDIFGQKKRFEKFLINPNPNFYLKLSLSLIVPIYALIYRQAFSSLKSEKIFRLYMIILSLCLFASGSEQLSARFLYFLDFLTPLIICYEIQTLEDRFQLKLREVAIFFTVTYGLVVVAYHPSVMSQFIR